MALSSMDSVSYSVDRDSNPRTSKIIPGTMVQINSRGTMLTKLLNSNLDRLTQLSMISSLERMNVRRSRV